MVELRRLERKNALNAGSNPAVPISQSSWVLRRLIRNGEGTCVTGIRIVQEDSTLAFWQEGDVRVVLRIPSRNVAEMVKAPDVMGGRRFNSCRSDCPFSRVRTEN